MKAITYLDENLYRKKKKALARYFRRNYKYLSMKVIPKLGKENKKDGIYEIYLPTEELFEKVYGKIYLHFSVKNDVAIIEDILPNDILISCYEKNLPTYKGIPYETERDLKKIKIVEKMIWLEKKEKNGK